MLNRAENSDAALRSNFLEVFAMRANAGPHAWKLLGHRRPSGGEAGCVDVSVAHSVVFDGLVKRRLQRTLDCAIN